jgi:hypothetical protein
MSQIKKERTFHVCISLGKIIMQNLEKKSIQLKKIYLIITLKNISKVESKKKINQSTTNHNRSFQNYELLP